MASGGWVATFEDITEQRKFEKERERHGEFLNQIIDNVPVMIMVKDAVERKFVHANRAAETFWGFSRTKRSARRCTRCFRTAKPTSSTGRCRGAEVRMPVIREAHSMVHSGRRAPGDVEASYHSRRRRQAAISGQRRRRRDRAKRLEQERDRDREFLNQIIENVPTTIVVKDVHTPPLCTDQSSGRGAFWRSPRPDHRQDRARNLSERDRRRDFRAR